MKNVPPKRRGGRQIKALVGGNLCRTNGKSLKIKGLPHMLAAPRGVPEKAMFFALYVGNLAPDAIAALDAATRGDYRLSGRKNEIQYAFAFFLLSVGAGGLVRGRTVRQ
ncbi:hypothetical protein [Trinickia symbiotica]|uniref:hypothetical protein n=1 Tax=Trinickia symbiotica TaxID=863227 RepID=UPI0011B06C3E|nr:hypothetical protein [Trinickia symbiotica]